MASGSASPSTATGVSSTSAPTIREIISTNRNPQIREIKQFVKSPTIRIFNKWEGVVSPKNKTHSGIFRDMHVGRVLSVRRTRLTLASLEICMCLKDHLDAKERKQDKCPLEIPLDFEEDVFDDEVQRNKAIPLSDEEIALDACREDTLSP
nr:hypothetical protein [Tanacetum cinerariifolium]